MTNQVSISRSARVSGVNIYNGKLNTATFHPAEEDSGLVFIVKGAKVPAKLEFAEKRRNAVGLDNGEQKVHLVEHLTSAVYALGIDNIQIELSDGVCPTTSNCAQEYLDVLRNIRVTQKAAKRFWKYAKNEETHVRNDQKRKPDCLKVSSADGFVIDYFAYYPHKVVGEQEYRFRFDEEIYARDIAGARSPGFIKNGLFRIAFIMLGKMGLHGISEQNYLLITSESAERYANSEEFGVKYSGQEFVRHKVLDVIGTLALTGKQFVDTEFRFEMTGHRFDLYALKTLFSQGCFVDYVQP
jgi:UDP-3-O-[3-hydroxymyristoyl] N-acetylglucosamine deacetylase